MVENVLVALAIGIGVISSLIYAVQTWKGKVDPAPATWILMHVVFILSFWMYWHGSDNGSDKILTKNIGLTVGLINCAVICWAVIITNWIKGTLRVAFSRTQKRCLLAGAGVVVFWALTNHPITSYVLVQCIALVAYLATVAKLRQATKTVEPYYIWVAALLVALCAIYPAWVHESVYSWIYLGRAIPSTIFLIVLIARIKRRMKRSLAPA